MSTAQNRFHVSAHPCIIPYISYILIFLDINECETKVCDTKAFCTNTEGSFMCICQKGFTGNGRTCSGRSLENDAPYSRAQVWSDNCNLRRRATALASGGGILGHAFTGKVRFSKAPKQYLLHFENNFKKTYNTNIILLVY